VCRKKNLSFFKNISYFKPQDIDSTPDMPYKYTFLINYKKVGNRMVYDKQFECRMKCDRCTHVNEKTRKRCKNTVCLGLPLCHVHLRTHNHLRIKDSTIKDAGKGLFAYKSAQGRETVFRKDDIIAEYNGELLTDAEVGERYTEGDEYTAPYVVNFGEDKNLDGACIRYAAAFANHKKRKKDNNAEFLLVGENKLVLQATKQIRNNDEIFVYYGDEYRFDEPSKSVITSVRR
jgi:hypothetical protein